MNLVIVESPTKARTISRFLEKDYEIKFSMGHVMDLPKSRLGVDIENGFKPQYEIISDKKKIIAQLKKAAKDSDSIILATDPDREGEAIASHVAGLLQKTENRKQKTDGRKTDKSDRTEHLKRIVFHEITQEAIQEALKNPRSIDNHLVDAQTARRVLDRLVGYKLSPLLWKKIRRGLSAGRVQSVALRLIIEREREIEKFKKEPYFTIGALLTSNKQQLTTNKKSEVRSQKLEVINTEFDLVEINGEKIEIQQTLQLYDGEYKVTKTSIATEDQAQRIVSDLKIKQFIVADVIKKEIRRSPLPPYTTSTLQQDASRRMGFNGKRTMSLAQKLYEEGYITYHRTDSVTVSLSFQTGARKYIKENFGERYLPKTPRFYKTKQKLAQEAHEAIRPTAVGQISNIKYPISNITGEQGWRLYELIWRRAVASQMSDAVIESTTVVVDSQVQSSKFKVQSSEKENIYRLKANGSVLVFDGFLKANPLGLSDNRLPKFTVSEKLNLVDVLEKEHETLPPPRYNDASLIKTLEEKGIGRPSTYATIVSTIESRFYIEKEQGRFKPTTVGVAVNDFLVANFSTIDDIPFTALMEDELDEIAKGEREWAPMIQDFYAPFAKRLEKVEEDAGRVKIAVEETNENCSNCGSKLVVRTGRFGKFLSCSKFPKCKFTKAFVETTNLTCPKDRGQIVIKKTKKGRRFYGCSNYPSCTFAAWKPQDIKTTTSQHVEPQRDPASREKIEDIKKHE